LPLALCALHRDAARLSRASLPISTRSPGRFELLLLLLLLLLLREGTDTVERIFPHRDWREARVKARFRRLPRRVGRPRIINPSAPKVRSRRSSSGGFADGI